MCCNSQAFSFHKPPFQEYPEHLCLFLVVVAREPPLKHPQHMLWWTNAEISGTYAASVSCVPKTPSILHEQALLSHEPNAPTTCPSPLCPPQSAPTNGPTKTWVRWAFPTESGSGCSDVFVTLSRSQNWKVRPASDPLSSFLDSNLDVLNEAVFKTCYGWCRYRCGCCYCCCSCCGKSWNFMQFWDFRVYISACQAAPAILPSTLAVAKHRQPQEHQGWKQMDFAQGNSSSGYLATTWSEPRKSGMYSLDFISWFDIIQKRMSQRLHTIYPASGTVIHSVSAATPKPSIHRLIDFPLNLNFAFHEIRLFSDIVWNHICPCFAHNSP